MLYMIKIYIFLIKYNKNIKIILTFICSIKFFNKKYQILKFFGHINIQFVRFKHQIKNIKFKR